MTCQADIEPMCHAYALSVFLAFSDVPIYPFIGEPNECGELTPLLKGW